MDGPMKSQEALLRRRKEVERLGAEEIARALTRTLVLLPFKGNCTCGMMLTERDRTPNKATFSCPSCARLGLPATAKPAPAEARRPSSPLSVYGT
jgi:hypothetical protein